MARTAETIQAEIDKVRAEAANSAQDVTVGNLRTTYRHEQNRKLALQSLHNELALAQATKRVRQIRIFTSGGF